jgi:hypothetical protein
MNFMLIYKAVQLASDSNKTKRDSQEGEKIILSYAEKPCQRFYPASENNNYRIHN